MDEVWVVWDRTMHRKASGSPNALENQNQCEAWIERHRAGSIRYIPWRVKPKMTRLEAKYRVQFGA